MTPDIRLHGKSCLALSSAGIARHCLTSESTVTRWRASGKLKPAERGTTAGARVSYFFTEDLARLRAESLTELRSKAAAAQLTPEERVALVTADLAELIDGVDQVVAVFKQIVERQAAVRKT